MNLSWYRMCKHVRFSSIFIINRTTYVFSRFYIVCFCIHGVKQCPFLLLFRYAIFMMQEKHIFSILNMFEELYSYYPVWYQFVQWLCEERATPLSSSTLALYVRAVAFIHIHNLTKFYFFLVCSVYVGTWYTALNRIGQHNCMILNSLFFTILS